MPAKTVSGLVFAAVILAGCGGNEPISINETEATPVPDRYYFDQDDLSREHPRDICRAAHPQFLEDLIGRIRRALPPAEGARFRFHDFNVSDRFGGKGREATLRFTVDRGEQEAVLMYATGAFDPAACEISGMRAGVGASPYAAKGREFPVP